MRDWQRTLTAWVAHSRPTTKCLPSSSSIAPYDEATQKLSKSSRLERRFGICFAMEARRGGTQKIHPSFIKLLFIRLWISSLLTQACLEPFCIWERDGESEWECSGRDMWVNDVTCKFGVQRPYIYHKKMNMYIWY